MSSIYTGTTPTLTFLFHDVDFSQAYSFTLTFSYPVSRQKILEKSGDDIVIDGTTVGVFLTQEETLAFPEGEVLVMLNWLYPDGTKVRRACSKEKKLVWKQNLKREVME